MNEARTTSVSARKSGPSLRVVAPPASRSLRRPGVVAEVRLALHQRNRAAVLLGALLGGGVPVASYWLAHYEADREVTWALVAGGLVFSALTVARWARSAFGSWAKAAGFTVLLEGVLVLARTPTLALGALAYLVFINAVATGVQLALEGRRS